MTSTTNADDDDKICPFCGDSDFDLIGLKSHLMMGDCEPFNDTPSINEEMMRLRARLDKK